MQIGLVDSVMVLWLDRIVPVEGRPLESGCAERTLASRRSRKPAERRGRTVSTAQGYTQGLNDMGRGSGAATLNAPAA